MLQELWILNTTIPSGLPLLRYGVFWFRCSNDLDEIKHGMFGATAVQGLSNSGAQLGYAFLGYLIFYHHYDNRCYRLFQSSFTIFFLIDLLFWDSQ